MRYAVIPIVLFAFACSKPQSNVYISDIAFGKFDSARFELTIDGETVLIDTTMNRYLSFYWEDTTADLPTSKFDLGVRLNGDGFSVAKDTTLQRKIGHKLFVLFDFTPYHKRYHNIEMYRDAPEGEFNLKELADSLYEIIYCRTLQSI